MQYLFLSFSSFFFNFIWYLFIYLLTLRCKSTINFLNMYCLVGIINIY
uniref:Uncharacterized protein n=1 Tax=Podoviridae sp. ctJDl18 TaxID=2825242 RepID=A0A8S5V0V1_9CAUD|nr:MAG TPA: hypothetical protein [Podoviridae sp. ctJDl18]